MLFKKGHLAIPAILGATQAAASTTSFCPDSPDVCFRWGVPEASSGASAGDIYFQMEAPISYQWIGLGIGKFMSGATMFVMYQDGKGNVTVSNREGKGHSIPSVIEQDQITLLDGSGVNDGRMVANIRYKSTGKLDVSGNTDWIMAQKEGPSLDSADPKEPITRHDSHAAFKVDLAKALIPSDANPFTKTSEGQGEKENGASDVVASPNQSNPNQNLILAHGVILSIAFVALYPLGSLLMPLLGRWYIHAGWQMVAFTLMWAGFGIGYVVSSRLDMFLGQAHTRLGLAVVVLLSAQPVLGWLHHLQYRKLGRRSAFGHVHIWYGRSLMVLGVVNGGLGLQLTGASSAYIVAYSVVAALSALSYAGFSVVKMFRAEKTVEVKQEPVDDNILLRGL